jgi:hypothetical protein
MLMSQLLSLGVMFLILAGEILWGPRMPRDWTSIQKDRSRTLFQRQDAQGTLMRPTTISSVRGGHMTRHAMLKVDTWRQQGSFIRWSITYTVLYVGCGDGKGQNGGSNPWSGESWVSVPSVPSLVLILGDTYWTWKCLLGVGTWQPSSCLRQLLSYLRYQVGR